MSDGEWAFVESLLPRCERGSRRLGDRTVLNGIVWKFRTGTAWRDVPEWYGLALDRIVRTGRLPRRGKARGAL